MNFNLPNLLTLIRLGLIPVFVIVYFLPMHWAPPAAALIFALAGVTDWLDGFLARRLHQSSAFGAFLDPVADKLMVAIALILLLHNNPAIMLTIPVMVIISREIAISGLREWLAGVGARQRVAVSWLGKVKTTIQMVAIVMLLYRYSIGPWPIYDLGMVLLFIAAALTVWSMFMYLRAAWPELRVRPSLDSESSKPTISPVRERRE
jgi:CDP-diacylglycerol--glycerol-3-phosphate 3-phosphatidyltransferase/cardiolipin synthase